MVRLNKRLDRDMDYYELPVEHRYVDHLIETDEAIVVGNIIIDVPALVKRKFVCHTDLCIGDKPLGTLRERSCCTSFDVRVAPKEIDQIDKVVPTAKKAYPTIAKAIKKNDDMWWHYDDEDFNKVLEVKPDGGCVFLTPREDGFYKCGLHAAALKKGLDPNKHKPSACALFPLFMLEIDDDYLLTCYSEETKHVIDEEGDYKHFDCLSANKLATKPLYQEMKEVIIYMFGKKVYKKIHKEAKRRKLV